MQFQNIPNYGVAFRFICACLVMLVATAMSTHAQDTSTEAVVEDFQSVFTSTTDKAIQLAETIPEDQYDWRPAEEVRSIREVVLHVAGSSYFFGSMLGAEMPENVDPRSMEQSGMSKSEAIAALEESITYIHDFLGTLTEEDLASEIDFFGNKVTKREAMIILGGHASEHLGQLIAYARMNGVTPPWSQS